MFFKLRKEVVEIPDEDQGTSEFFPKALDLKDLSREQVEKTVSLIVLSGARQLVETKDDRETRHRSIL